MHFVAIFNVETSTLTFPSLMIHKLKNYKVVGRNDHQESRQTIFIPVTIAVLALNKQ